MSDFMNENFVTKEIYSGMYGYYQHHGYFPEPETAVFITDERDGFVVGFRHGLPENKKVPFRMKVDNFKEKYVHIAL